MADAQVALHKKLRSQVTNSIEMIHAMLTEDRAQQGKL